jgi:SAM-dependent methyltransferase
MASSWKAYNELAWTEGWLVDPAGCEDEASRYVALIQAHAARRPVTMLHLGSGAGGLDRVFKRHFTVTGVDLSAGMLARARTANPEIEYLEGDMRSIQLDREFDVVAIPDGIDYMASLEDLDRAIGTAFRHLKPDGVLLVIGKTTETFQDNNFAYTGERDGVHVTLLENNHVDRLKSDTYEATLVYLVRREGELEIHVDRHVLGLFPQATWEQLFAEHGLDLRQSVLDGVYDAYLLGDGAYPMQVFIGRRSDSA